MVDLANELVYTGSGDFKDYPPPLRLVQSGRQEEFKNLVDSSIDPMTILNCFHSKSGDTPLIVAARHGHLELLKFLVLRGVDIEQRNKDLKRPLHEAAAGSHLHCVKFLLARNAEIDCLKRADWTPLMLSCTKSKLDVIKALVEAGAKLALTNKDGWNCFHITAREGHTNILSFLLDCSPNIWNTCSKNGRSPLHTAALHGNLAAVKLMIKRCGYKPDNPDSCGSTPLMDSLRVGHIDVAETLIKEHEASVSVCDELGRQAIHHVSQAGCNESLEYLINNHSVNVSVCTGKSQMTPLHLASKEGHSETVKFLLEMGASVNCQDKNERTALHLSSAAGHQNCVEILLRSRDVDVNIKDCSGLTARSLALKPSVCRVFDTLVPS